MANLNLKELEAIVRTNTCKGKIYKCKISVYIDSKDNYTEKTVMMLQKRISCKGCEFCDWEQEDINEGTYCNRPPIITKPEHDSLYRLAMTNVGTDWETGYVDSWDTEFIKLEENHEQKVA
jgi:hypothetical protein